MENRSGETIALVTGANRGIGREICMQLGRKGVHVIVAGRNAGAVGETVEAIRSSGGSAEALILDASDSASIEKAAGDFSKSHGHLDVLVNNAAIYKDKDRSILTITREEFIESFQTNTFGPVEIAQRFLPALRQAGGARIVNYSSGYGQIGGLSHTVPGYCLSKLALNGATLMLSAALREEGIAVNSVCPGWVRTDMGGANAPRSVDQGADTAVWLATEADASITGKFFRDRAEIPW